MVLLLAVYVTQAQVGIGTASPAASAQLEVTSTTKGFLPPRMTTAQRDDSNAWCQDFNNGAQSIDTKYLFRYAVKGDGAPGPIE